MENRLLDFLEAIQAQPSMTKAAQSIFVSQPYISRVIKKAEAAYRISLVDRDHRPIQLTYAGERLLAYLKSAAHLNQAMTTEMTQLRENESQTITLGITPPVAMAWFTQTLPAFYQRFPNMRTRIVEVSTSEAEKLLVDGQLDFFIGKTIHKPQVVSLPLTTVALSLIIPKSFSFFRPGTFWRPFSSDVLTQLHGQPFIRSIGESRMQEIIDHYFSDQGVQTMPLIEVENLLFAMKLVVKGLGCTILSTEMLSQLTPEQRATVNAFRLPISQLSVDFSASYHRNHQLAGPLEFLAQQAQREFTTAILRSKKGKQSD